MCVYLLNKLYNKNRILRIFLKNCESCSQLWIKCIVTPLSSTVILQNFTWLLFIFYRLRIDLKSGEKINDDVVFHFNPRLRQYVYMNNYVNGVWQREQLASDKPFTNGATFSILIVFKSECFEVRICYLINNIYIYIYFFFFIHAITTNV